MRDNDTTSLLFPAGNPTPSPADGEQNESSFSAEAIQFRYKASRIPRHGSCFEISNPLLHVTFDNLTVANCLVQDRALI